MSRRDNGFCSMNGLKSPTMSAWFLSRRSAIGACLLGLLVLVGCDRPPTQFESNVVQRVVLEQQTGVGLQQATADVDAALLALFGTPDQPIVPAVLTTLVDEENIRRASGGVASGEDGQHVGLYREHCAVCHGLNGSGRGPAAALQNPYPRDFRRGTFKFKSTPRGQQPTRSDLLRTLVAGEPGTSMPSFAALLEEDREALVDYVMFLAVRGQLERELLSLAAREYDYGDEPLQAAERLFAAEASAAEPQLIAKQLEDIEQTLVEIVDDWSAASQHVISVPPLPDYVGRAVAVESAGELDSELAGRVSERLASVQRGEALFHGEIANCVGCHGKQGAGDAVTLDFDDWTKDWTTRIGVTPSDREAIAPFQEVGALRPRPAKPRNLQLGAFRGGSHPAELYTRIAHGIDGTPMPAVTIVEEPSGLGLTVAQVWDLVNYVLSLSAEDVAAVSHENLVLPESTL